MRRRMLVVWVFAIFASVVVAADLSDLADIPQCGSLCIINTVLEKSSCQLTDFQCICANATLNAEIESCILADCTPREALKTAKIAKSLCGVKPRNKSFAVWLVPLLNIILSTVFYLLRLLSRFVLRQGIDIGDITLGASVALTFPILWATFAVSGSGLGQDAWNIPPDNITDILYLFWWSEIFYQAGLPLTRISILCFYLKIFPQERIRKASFVLIGLNVANLVGFVIASIFQCYPVYGAWTFWDGSFHGHCNDLHVQSWVQAAFNIFFDLLVIILPLPVLARLTASRQKKVHIILMFSLGFTVTIISILRLKTLVLFANSTNVSYDYVEPGLYSIVEASAAIICACLPAVRALLKSTMPTLFKSTVGRSAASRSEAPGDQSVPQTPDPLCRPCPSYTTYGDADSHMGIGEQWTPNSGIPRDSRSEANVELMPIKPKKDEVDVESGREGKENKSTGTFYFG